jgi:hypothetical protein
MKFRSQRIFSFPKWADWHLQQPRVAGIMCRIVRSTRGIFLRKGKNADPIGCDFQRVVKEWSEIHPCKMFQLSIMRYKTAPFRSGPVVTPMHVHDVGFAWPSANEIYTFPIMSRISGPVVN